MSTMLSLSVSELEETTKALLNGEVLAEAEAEEEAKPAQAANKVEEDATSSERLTMISHLSIICEYSLPPLTKRRQ